MQAMCAQTAGHAEPLAASARFYDRHRQETISFSYLLAVSPGRPG
jgi:hypothetical protein